MHIILASGSPRRAELLRQIGIHDFTVRPSGLDENIPYGGDPVEWTKKLALLKARDVAGRYRNALVLGADTTVSLGGRIYGKPEDRRDAVRMLVELSGKTHEVITGFAIVNSSAGGLYVADAAVTRVTFRSLDRSEIEAYVRSGEADDKAGAYGIQGMGAVFAERLEGCYFNVMGLPLSRLYGHLKTFGVEVLAL